MAGYDISFYGLYSIRFRQKEWYADRMLPSRLSIEVYL